MNGTSRSFTAALLACLALGSFLSAAAVGTDIILGLKFGLAVDDSDFKALPFTIERGSGATFGLRLGLRRDHFGAEVGYAHADRTLTPTPEAPAGLTETTLRLNVMSFNVLYYPFIKGSLRPYLSGGYAFYRADLVGYGHDRNDGFNLGLGLDLLLFKHVSLALDANHHWVGLTVAGAPFDLRSWTSNFSLNYHF